MRPLRNAISSFALLAGIAAISIQLGGGAFAAPAAAQPVCGIKADGPKYYLSARAAKADGARVMHPGDCQMLLCSGWAPKVALNVGLVRSTAICGMDPLTHARMTYPNECAIEAAGGTWVHAGPCKR
jgi:hypothetical protein